jgi:hypothetical protein
MLSPQEEILLESYADSFGAGAWRLSQDKVLSRVEGGEDLGELRAFLAARDEQELPDPVSAFLNLSERNARALTLKGPALLIACANAELAETLASHERSKKLCRRAGENHVVVKAADEEAFRSAAHLLGYGMPRA